MYVQTMLDIEETAKSTLETESAVGAHETNEEAIVDRIDPTSFSTMGEERRTEMSELLKEMAPFCSIRDVDFKDLA